MRTARPPAPIATPPRRASKASTDSARTGPPPVPRLPCRRGRGARLVKVETATESPCAMCHEYHSDGGKPWMPPRQRKKNAAAITNKRLHASYWCEHDHRNRGAGPLRRDMAHTFLARQGRADRFWVAGPDRRKQGTDMLIAQITDIHIGFDPDNPAEYNRKRLDEVLDVLIEGPNRPDLLLATGDITDRGDDDSYRRPRHGLFALPFPVWPSVGNHDLRDNFHARFPGSTTAQRLRPVQRSSFPNCACVTVDTLEEGRHGGAFCEQRAAWLDAELSKDSRQADLYRHAPPADRKRDRVDEHRPRRAVGCDLHRRRAAPPAGPRADLCGHLHRSVTVAWKGAPSRSARRPRRCGLARPSGPIDENRPDDRPMIVAEDPAYALHRWNGRELVSFYDHAGAHTMLAKYDERVAAAGPRTEGRAAGSVTQRQIDARL